MKICVIQREGVRHFSRFADIAERDKIEVELIIQDKGGKTVRFDLTSALIEEYAKHPDIGRVDPEAAARASASMSAKPLAIKESKIVSPAYITESKKQKDDYVARVKAAQARAVEERKKKNAATAKRLTEARIAKAEAQKAEAESNKKTAAKKSPSTKVSTNSQPKQKTSAKATTKTASTKAAAAKVAPAKKVASTSKPAGKSVRAKQGVSA
ncbi:MAG: hypothetical protein ACYC64_05745 [Armatimonadota bacterium]